MGQGCMSGGKVVEDEVIGKKDSNNHHGIVFRPVNVFKDPSTKIVYLPEAKKLISLHNRLLRIWDMESFKCVESIKNFCGHIIKWGENGILSFSNSSKIKNYEVNTQKPYIGLKRKMSVEVDSILSVVKMTSDIFALLLNPQKSQDKDERSERVLFVSCEQDLILSYFETKCSGCPSPIISRRNEKQFFTEYRSEETGKVLIGLIDYMNSNVFNYFEGHVEDDCKIRSMVSYMNAEKDEILICGGICPTKSLVYFFNSSIIQNNETYDPNYNLVRKIGIREELTFLSCFQNCQPKYLSLCDIGGNLHVYDVDTKKRKFKRTFSNKIHDGTIQKFRMIQGEKGIMSIACADNAITINNLLNLPYSKCFEVEETDKKPDKFFQMGEKFFKEEDFDQAIREFTKGIELSPSDNNALLRRAYCYYSTENYQNAVSDFKKVLSCKPNDENVLFNLGNAYFDAKKFEKSLVFFDKVIVLNDKSDDAFFRRGLIHLKLKNYEAAVKDFSKIIELIGDRGEEGDKKSNEVDAYCYRGITYINVEEYERATSDLERALKMGHAKAATHLDQVQKKIRKMEKMKEFECTQYVMYTSDIELLYDEREERKVELFKDPHEYLKSAKEKKEKVIIKFEDSGDLFIGEEKVDKAKICDEEDGGVEKGVIWNEQGVVCIRYMDDYVDFKHFFLVIDRKVSSFNPKFRKFLG